MENQQKIRLEELKNQLPYYPASESCQPLDSVVPKTLAIEQKNFALQLKEIYEKEGGVANFVMNRLQYKDIDSFCRAFSKEQIDGIATAIYNFENRNFGLIIADQTGLGKGRIIAGLIRYSLVHLKKKPAFFTIDKTLFSDIYRDLIDIEFEANIPTFVFGKYEMVDVDAMSDEEIEDIIREDINDNNLKIDYEFDENEYDNIEDAIDDSPEILEDLIEKYRDFIRENGIQSPPEKISPKQIEKKILEAQDKGLQRVIPFASQPFTISTGEGILYSRKKKEIDEAVKKNKVPIETNLLLMTYSQLRSGLRGGVKTDKLKMIENFTNDNVVILDESHKGAGSGSNTNAILKTLLKNASDIAYVSATYSKRESNMPIYTIGTAMKEAMLTDNQLISAFENGDTALKEAVSAELTKIGQLVRRERKFEGETFYEEESESSNTGIEQIHKLNQTAIIWNKIVAFQNEFFGKTRELSMQYANANPTIWQSGYVKKTRSIRARTFELFNYFLLSIKVKQATKKIKEELENGRKVVVSIANTMESSFSNLKKDYYNNDSYELGDVVPNDFQQVMLYLLAESMKFNFDGVEISDSGRRMNKRELISILKIPKNAKGLRYQFAKDLFDSISQDFNELVNEIKARPFDVPLSPIDEIIARLSDSGFTIKEVTGRSKKLKFTKNSEGRFNFREGVLEKRTDKDKLTLVKQFNENQVDALIINQSSATGVSMHSLPTLVNKKIVPPVDKLPQKTEDGNYYVPTSLLPRNEVKARTMIIVQMELDVNTEVQKLGRVNRTGQIFPPNYYYIISCIPAEKRLQAIMKKKLSSLMSLTSGGQNQGDDLFTADDFFSKEAVEPFNDAVDSAKDFAGQIDVALDIEKAKNKGDIEKGTKAFYFMNYDVQKLFFDEFAEKLRKRIEELIAANLYEGAITFKDYKSTTNSLIPYLVCNDNAYTEFGRHVFAEWNTIRAEQEKKLDTEILSSLMSAEEIEQTLKKLNDLIEDDNNNLANQNAKAETDTKDYLQRIENYKDELSKLPNGEELERLKNEKTEKEDLLREIKRKVLEKIDNNEFDEEKILLEDKQQQYAKELQKTNDKIFAIVGESTIATFTSQIRSLNNDINYAQERIEAIKNSLVKAIERVEKHKMVYEIAKEKIGQVGNVFEFTTFREDTIGEYDNNGDYIIEKFEYEPKKTTNVVLCRVRVQGLNPSEVDLIFMHITEIKPNPLSQLTPLSFTEDDLLKGKKPIYEIEDKGFKFDFENYWLKYISSIDTFDFKQRIFLSGNILKAKAFQNLMSSDGRITKYNTLDNKLKLGVETNDSDFAKFNEAVNYSLLMSLSEDNFNRILLPLIAIHINYPVVYLELIFGRSRNLLVILINDDLRDLVNQELRKYPINVDRSQFSDETQYELAIEDAKNKNIQSFIETIKSNKNDYGILEKVRFVITSPEEQEIFLFNETLKEIGSENNLTTEQFNNYEGIAHKVYNFPVPKNKKGETTFSKPINIDEVEVENYNSFLTPTSMGNSILIRKTPKWVETGFQYYPTFGIFMTPSALLSLVNYFQAVENFQMVCACTKLSLDLAEPQYVFNLAGSSMGEIDNLIGERIDNIGSRAIVSIENILDELVKILA